MICPVWYSIADMANFDCSNGWLPKQGIQDKFFMNFRNVCFGIQLAQNLEKVLKNIFPYFSKNIKKQMKSLTIM